MSTIAAFMGGHKSLLTYYFKTKQALMVALVDDCIRRYETFYQGTIQKIDDPLKRFTTAVELLFSRQWDDAVDTTVFYACFYLSLRNEQVKSRFKKMYGRFLTLLESELDLYMQKGLIPKADSRSRAVYILSLMEGFDLLWITMGPDFDFNNHTRFIKAQVMTMLQGEKDET